MLAKGKMSPRLQEPNEQEPLFSAQSHLLTEFLEMVSVAGAASDPFARFFLADKNVVLRRLGVAFDGDGRDRMVRSFCRQAGEAHAVLRSEERRVGKEWRWWW